LVVSFLQSPLTALLVFFSFFCQWFFAIVGLDGARQ
jgi:hypothetical protein